MPERHSDTEEVTGSNPVRPTLVTWHFLFLVLPGSALRPYNWPYNERYRRLVALNCIQHDSDDVPDTVIPAGSMTDSRLSPHGNQRSALCRRLPPWPSAQLIQSQPCQIRDHAFH